MWLEIALTVAPYEELGVLKTLGFNLRHSFATYAGRKYHINSYVPRHSLKGVGVSVYTRKYSAKSIITICLRSDLAEKKIDGDPL